MMTASPLRVSAFLLGFLGVMSVALAQTPAPDQSKPDQNAKQEPSAKTTSDTPGSAGVLVNGVLAVPGAPTDTSTVPAKFSQKNNADDHLPILSYTFKHLTDDQKRAIYQSVIGKPGAPKVADASPQVGDALPGTLALAPLPSDATAQVPDLQKFQYTLDSDKVMVVNPVNMVVVAVIGAK
jgi:hypothetical protein